MLTYWLTHPTIKLESRDAPMHWPIIGRPIISIKQSANTDKYQKNYFAVLFKLCI